MSELKRAVSTQLKIKVVRAIEWRESLGGLGRSPH